MWHVAFFFQMFGSLILKRKSADKEKFKESDLCVCVASTCLCSCFVFSYLCVCCSCLTQWPLSRAATPPSSAKFCLWEIVVLSRLSPQPSCGAVLTAGSDLSLVSVFVCLSQVSGLSCVFFCSKLSPYIHNIHSLINCTYKHTCINTCMLAYMHTYILLSAYTLTHFL